MTVKELMEILKNFDENDKIELFGYCDGMGEEAYMEIKGKEVFRDEHH